MTAAPQEFPFDWVCCTRYGVAIATIGDEGQHHVTPGKVEPRRMVAAVNAHERICIGLDPDERDAGAGTGAVSHVHAYRGTLGGEAHPYGEPGEDYLSWGVPDSVREPRTIPMTVLSGDR